MKRVFLGIAIAAAALGSARAETVFVGNSFIDAVTGGASCTSTFVVGDSARVIWRPRGLGNGADSQLTYYGSRSAFHMHLSNNDFKTGVNYAGHSIGSTGNIGTNTGGIVDWSQAPAAVAAGTPTVKVVAKIANFFRINPCTVTLRVNLIRR
jgi:hypothetical protein